MDIDINIDNLNKTLLEQGFTKARVSNNKELIQSVVQYVIENTEIYKQAEEEINQRTEEIKATELDLKTRDRQLFNRQNEICNEEQRLQNLKKEIDNCTSQDAKDKMLIADFFKKNVGPVLNNSEAYKTYIESLSRILS